MARAEPSPAAPARLAAPGRLADRGRLAVAARAAAGLAGLAAGVGALAVAEGPGRSTTYTGSSAAGAVLTVFAGWQVARGAPVDHIRICREVRVDAQGGQRRVVWGRP